MTLPQDQSFDIEEQNPMFHDTEMKSYPAQLPFDHNRHTFKNIDDVNSTLRAVDVEGQLAHIIVGGLPLRTCTLHVQENETLKDRISVNFDSRLKSLKEKIQDLKCREVPMDDDILIGEKVSDVLFNFTYNKAVLVEYSLFDPYQVKSRPFVLRKFTISDSDRQAEQTFYPPALGFSTPGICNEAHPAAAAVQEGAKEYTQPDMTVIKPHYDQKFVNVSKPYPEARYCNTRVCYAHHAYDADKGESSSDIIQTDKDTKYLNEDYGSYWVLDADRAATGVCFYVGYFLERLFKYLGMAYDISALTAIEDFNYMAFVTTRCKYDERQIENAQGGDVLADEAAINRWLSSRGCGAQVEFEPPEESNKTVYGEMTEAQLAELNAWMRGQIDKPRWVDSIMGEGGYVVTGVSSITEDPHIKSHTVQARVVRMYANSENLPDADVTEILDSLENSFGCKFAYDAELNKVTVYLLRDIFRSTAAPRHLNAHVNTIYKMTEKITGVRMQYDGESDEQEQRQNLREGKKDYDTTYDYIEYPENRTKLKQFDDVAKKIDIPDLNVYVDLRTGDAFRIKVDKDATTYKELKPTVFEVGQYKGIEAGDCSKDNEDYITELTSSFQPIVVNDVNYKNATAHGSAGGYEPLLVPYMDADMAHEHVMFKIQNPFTVVGKEAYFTYVMTLTENYDPSNTDDGGSPLQDYDWGLTVGILRTGDGGEGVENYDPDYDGFDNWRWRDVANNYCMSADTMDQTGRWLGKTDKANTFSLKIRAYKPFRYKYVDDQLRISTNPKDWEDGTWLIPCDDDERDSTGRITKRVRSRGLADVFMAEYIHFLLHRRKYRITALVEIAQLADIPNHWRERWEIAGKIGYIDKLKYGVDEQKGIGEVTIDFYEI